MRRIHKRRCNLRLLVYALVAVLIGTCSSPPSLLDQILEVGELRVVTRDSPTTYFVGPEGPAGPEFDLVRGLADDLGVKLVINSVDSTSEILPHLIRGESHMAAAGLSITMSRVTTRNSPTSRTWSSNDGGEEQVPMSAATNA